jgi:hypothetical protein
MAAFALHAAVVISSAYMLSGIMLGAVILIGSVGLHWRIDRTLIPTMLGWGAVGLVGLAFGMRALETLSQG